MNTNQNNKSIDFEKLWNTHSPEADDKLEQIIDGYLKIIEQSFDDPKDLSIDIANSCILFENSLAEYMHVGHFDTDTKEKRKDYKSHLETMLQKHDNAVDAIGMGYTKKQVIAARVFMQFLNDYNL